MPSPGMRWRFIVINTKYSWNHGSPRGFRSRGHRIHSSGDYRNPPPQGEHEGLLDYRHNITKRKVQIPERQRVVIGNSIIGTLSAQPFRVKAVSVSSDHAHILVELPDNPKQIKAIIGDAKRRSSRDIRDVLPGAVWSAGCGYEPVDDESHFDRCEEYTLIKQGCGTWTWWHKDGGMWWEERVAGWVSKFG